jgi:hypothetical protein
MGRKDDTFEKYIQAHTHIRRIMNRRIEGMVVCQGNANKNDAELQS